MIIPLNLKSYYSNVIYYKILCKGIMFGKSMWVFYVNKAKSCYTSLHKIPWYLGCKMVKKKTLCSKRQS